MKKKMAILLASLLLGTSLCTMGVFAANEKYDVDQTYTITGFDVKTASGGVFVYPNDTDETRVIGSNEYNFRYSKVLIFDKNGVLIEAGGDLLANENGVNGSPQLTVKVPAGGFLVAYNSGAPKGLSDCYTTAMEGAMLYNATMSIIYPVYGEYDKNTSKLRIAYNNPVEPSDDAIKFLFVGNSTTYFNGTPIKFKGLCQAAGIEVDVDYCTFGSAYLHEFADATHERGKKLRNMLQFTEYDYVVLQDAAGASYYDSEAAVATMLPLIKENGATPLLYMRYSNDLDPETRVQSFYKHYSHYSRLSLKFDIEYAPAASSFLKCIEEHPEINLFADDGGHHSYEGSYLIACSWLYSYLGVDPRGNTYTANLPAATATALQEMAAVIVEEGYPYPGSTDVTKTEIDGVTYENLSLNKPYVTDGETYTNASWTDTAENGSPMGKFTNGLTAESGDSGECGCYKGSNTSVTIDLGSVSAIKQVSTDLFGNTSWGIPSTADSTVKLLVSVDGVNFQEVGEISGSDMSVNGNWDKRDYVLTLDETVEARYVKLQYGISGTFLWVSEISVYGTAGEGGDVSDNPDESEVSDVPNTSDTTENSDNSAPASDSENVSEQGGTSSGSGLSKRDWGIIGAGAVVIVAVVAVTAVILKKKK